MKSFLTLSIQTIVGFVLFLSPAAAFSSELQWPELTSQNKAWTRWWWLGSVLDRDGVTAEMEKYAAAGLGGLEITPIYGVKGYEDRFLNYLSPEWMEMLEFVLSEAKRLDMQIDMATGNGWPFGGPWVEPRDACRNVFHKTFALKGGESLIEPIVYVQETMARAEGHRVNINDLSDPVSSNKNLQQLALTQVRFARNLPLQTLMAYSDGGDAVDLTDRVSDDGRLDWSAPDGDWTLYAVFMGWHGKQVERAGPGGEGDVIDHFSKTALQRYLKRFDEAYKGYDVDSIRAYFNDSYEVDDAAGESNWTDGFLNEFKKRRGYDLRQHLPALFQREDDEESLRVKCDYRETISDLLLEEFTIPWREWAGTHKAMIRNQSHGSPANILDLYAASSIPETEGRDVFQFKFASSAAHVTGKPVAACEASTWLNEHFLSTLGDVKSNVDDYFLGGVNHIVYHGTPYSPPEAGYPGWMFYASVHLGTTNSLWPHFSALNQYVGRVQSFLQAGSPANDVLLYYPFHDAISRPSGRSTMQHFSGQGRGDTASEKVARVLYDRGYSFDHISDRQIANCTVDGGAIVTGGVSYRALVIPETKYMPVDTLKKIVALAKRGATIVAQSALPSDVPGLWNEKRRRSILEKIKNSLRFTENAFIQKATLGQGAICMGDQIDSILDSMNVRREALVDAGLEFIRRRDGDSDVYFIVNKTTESVSRWIPLQAQAKSAVIYEPMLGRIGKAALRPMGDAVETFLQLAPGKSCVVKTYPEDIDASLYACVEPAGDSMALSGSWALTFEEGGPKSPAAVESASLGSWTEYEGDAYKSFSGVAKYSLSFERPSGDADAWVLDLGRVAESARVVLNGKELGTLICEPYQIEIEKDALQNTNTLEIHIANLMANRIADLDRTDSSWKKFYNINFPARERGNRGADGLFSAAQWKSRESGLIGPVRLIPYKRAAF